MAKRAIKARISKEQDGLCELSGTPLSTEFPLVDTDRILPKAEGGTYDDDNTRIVTPRAHMERHGTLRTREEALDELKAIFDDRVQTMKLLLKINNQLLAFQRRTDTRNAGIEAFLVAQMVPIEARLAATDKQIGKALQGLRLADPLVDAALNVPGLGPITVAALTVYIDMAKAATPSALWKYAGLHCAASERYTKGETSGGNKTLRTVLWNAANVMMKLRTSGYRSVYDRKKTQLEASEYVVASRNTQGKLVDVPWKDTKACHRHGAALRAVMKHLLADYWLVGRTLRGLPTRPLYVAEKLGHTGIVAPQERGWKL